MIAPARIQVRFADCDLMGHVNNAVYLSYFELARMHYFEHLLGAQWDWKKHGVLLRKNEVEYFRPVFLHDTPEITVFTEHIGTRSCTLAYELHVGDTLCTTGRSVLVSFDATTMQTTELALPMIDALKQLMR